jgi:hypothetical protein
MTTTNAGPSVSRRAALAGLGAGSVGIAFAASARPTAAQDATAELVNHPVVGAWNFAATDPTNPDDRAFAAFHTDGTFSMVHAIAGASVGVWRPTGKRTGELTAKSVNNTFDAGGYRAGTNSLWLAFEVAPDAKSLTGPVTVALTNPDGSYFAGFEAVQTATRLEPQPAPSLESLKAGTPVP